jgi:Zn-dependent peptidase ImmA (M78 family)/transcriptional regulator with XRE-family HTH domain
MKYRLPNDPEIVAVNFQKDQLTRARELKSYTKAYLAKLVEKTPSAITQFESGVNKPDSKTVAALSLALEMPPMFFCNKSMTDRLSVDDCHFRSLRSASQSNRRQSIRTGELIYEVVEYLEHKGAIYPENKILKLKNEINLNDSVKDIALKTRTYNGLGVGPIEDPIKLIESWGAIVIPLPYNCREVGAFSTWVKDRPVIIHFDIAHELCHLLIHDDVKPGDPVCEKEADSFASSFLIPDNSFANECPKSFNLQTFIALKKRWNVSIRALLYKANNRGHISESSYRRALMYMNKNYGGYNEPAEWKLKKPSMLKTMLMLADSAGLPLKEIANDLALNEKFLKDILKPITD